MNTRSAAWAAGFAFLVTAAGAQSEPPVWHEPDLSLGTYFWFVALNNRCTESNTARQTAIEKYRVFFFSSAKVIAEKQSDDQKREMLRRIETSEKDGAPKDIVEHYEALLNKGSAGDIEALCRSAASDIEQRIAVLKAMAESSERAKIYIQRSQTEQR